MHSVANLARRAIAIAIWQPASKSANTKKSGCSIIDDKKWLPLSASGINGKSISSSVTQVS
jgi:hypothetical protein